MGVCSPGESAARGAAALPTRTVLSPGSTIMYGALLLFESEFVHIVAISFTSLILTELLMVALTIQTWHWLMTVAELLSLACYIASLVFLHEFIGETPALHGKPGCRLQRSPSLRRKAAPGTGSWALCQHALALDCPTDCCPCGMSGGVCQPSGPGWAGSPCRELPLGTGMC